MVVLAAKTHVHAADALWERLQELTEQVHAVLNELQAVDGPAVEVERLCCTVRTKL